MKSDFMLALTQLSAEKNLPAEVVITAIESALVSAYRKESFALNQNIAVKINPNSGKVEVWAEKTVVEKVTDTRREITLNEARRIKPDLKIDDTVMVEDTPQNAGRIAAQTAKQVILQRLNEAEYSAIYEEFTSREGDVVTVVVQRMEPGQIIVDLGRTEGVLPAAEQVRTERYRAGQRLKVVILQVVRTGKGPKVMVSRSHPDLLRRLFEIEVPEVHGGTVEIKAIAREAGFRSKIAVAARQEGVDPVGCCVGLRGIRIQNIVKELNGEKIDVIQWHPDSAVFIANALSPAHIISVETNKATEIATVIVPDKQLSLAIGKEGQNARLAAKLTGWKIDIKSSSAAEAEKPVPAKPAAEAVPEAVEAPAVETVPAEVAEIPVAVEAAPAAPAEEIPAVSFVLKPPVPVREEKTQLRFAEDILAPLPPKPSTKAVKGKKKKGYREGEEAKPKKKRREVVEVPEEEEEF
ncbi:MAG: transcription termination factor NusA [Dehalococcoidales bacterium]|nr:transcription termination factor NusA [Dehalococcoidales bacterium]